MSQEIRQVINASPGLIPFHSPTVLVLPLTFLIDDDVIGSLAPLRGQTFTVIPQPCIDRLARFGCWVQLIANARDDAQLDDVLERVDGVLLLGGEDVEASRWGGGENDCVSPNPSRDAFEFGVIARALERELPVLGICRGAQLLNIASGGTLIAHLNGDRGVPHISEQNGLILHDVAVSATWTHTANWPERIRVASGHHQAIASVGEGLEPVASAEDGVIEALAGRQLPVLAVQWHPEYMDDDEPAAVLPFAWLAARAHAHRAVVTHSSPPAR